MYVLHLKQGQNVTEGRAKGPGPVEGRVRGDGHCGDAHYDVGHGHVDQVHTGVHPQVRSSQMKCHLVTESMLDMFLIRP